MVVWLGAGTDIMKFVAGAQCHRGGKTVLRYLLLLPGTASRAAAIRLLARCRGASGKCDYAGLPATVMVHADFLRISPVADVQWIHAEGIFVLGVFFVASNCF